MASEIRDPEDQSRLRRRIVLVVCLWVGLFAWANIPPFRGNVLDHKPARFVWNWDLYALAGHNVCDVRYYDMNRRGAAIERWSLLGYERLGDMPADTARIYRRELAGEHERVCRALRERGDKAPRVEVWARCGQRSKWKQLARRRRNVCATDKPATKRASRRGSKR